MKRILAILVSLFFMLGTAAFAAEAPKMPEGKTPVVAEKKAPEKKAVKKAKQIKKRNQTCPNPPCKAAAPAPVVVPPAAK